MVAGASGSVRSSSTYSTSLVESSAITVAAKAKIYPPTPSATFAAPRWPAFAESSFSYPLAKQTIAT